MNLSVIFYTNNVIAYERTTITFNNKSPIVGNASIISKCPTKDNNKGVVNNSAIVCHPVFENYFTTAVDNGAVVDKGGRVYD
jgi:hypothetical protein